jgi:hypothetical protein
MRYSPPFRGIVSALGALLLGVPAANAQTVDPPVEIAPTCETRASEREHMGRDICGETRCRLQRFYN